MSNVAQIRQNRAAEERQDPLHERAALAAAIGMASKSTSAVTAATDALRRGRDLVAQAEAKVAAATAAVGAARELDSKAAAKAMRTRSDAPAGGSTKQARRDLDDATDQLEMLREACARLESELADAAAEQKWRSNGILVTRAEVLRPFAEEILERAAQLHRDFKICEALAAELLNREDRDAPSFDDEIVAMKAQAARTEPFGDLRKQASAFFLNRTLSADTSAAVTEAVAGLRAAVAALAKDPSTPLPPLP